MNLALFIIAGIAALATVYFGLRYGDVHRFGDSEYRRLATSDKIAVLVPALVLGISLMLLALRRFAGGSLTAQWHREAELLAGVTREKERIRAGPSEGNKQRPEGLTGWAKERHRVRPSSPVPITLPLCPLVPTGSDWNRMNPVSAVQVEPHPASGDAHPGWNLTGSDNWIVDHLTGGGVDGHGNGGVQI